jgi:trk system potassium uptake protein TrkH
MSILYYRQQLQWLGGMGIIVLAVAVLPMLGIGGMQLYRAETPGPMKDNKLTPRITETAKALWYIYLGLTVGLRPGLLARRNERIRRRRACVFDRRDRWVLDP